MASKVPRSSSSLVEGPDNTYEDEDQQTQIDFADFQEWLNQQSDVPPAVPTPPPAASASSTAPPAPPQVNRGWVQPTGVINLTGNPF